MPQPIHMHETSIYCDHLRLRRAIGQKGCQPESQSYKSGYLLSRCSQSEMMFVLLRVHSVAAGIHMNQRARLTYKYPVIPSITNATFVYKWCVSFPSPANMCQPADSPANTWFSSCRTYETCMRQSLTLRSSAGPPRWIHTCPPAPHWGWRCRWFQCPIQSHYLSACLCCPARRVHYYPFLPFNQHLRPQEPPAYSLIILLPTKPTL